MSDTRSVRHTRLPSAVHNRIKSTPETFRRLLEQYEAYETIHGRDWSVRSQTLLSEGVLVRVGRCNTEHPACDQEDKCAVKLYRFHSDLIADAIREALPSPNPYCPNDNRGVRNLRGSELYTCTDDDCGCRFTREQAEEVLDDGR